MSQILTAEDRRNHGGRSCSFCGCTHPSAVWRGAEFVHCCSTCAKEILPALMADAVARYNPQALYSQVFPQIEKNFWKALYLTTRETPKV